MYHEQFMGNCAFNYFLEKVILYFRVSTSENHLIKVMQIKGMDSIKKYFNQYEILY